MEIRGKYYAPVSTQTVQPAQEQGDTVISRQPALTTPDRKVKCFHLNSPADTGRSQAKRRRKD